MCHRFLPIDRYNKYQSNQIYRFLSIDFSGSIPLYGHCANCKHCTHCENGRFLLIRSLVTTKSQLAFELQSSGAFEKCSNAWRSSKCVWVPLCVLPFCVMLLCVLPFSVWYPDDSGFFRISSFYRGFFFFTNFDSVYFRFDFTLFTFRLLNFVIDIPSSLSLSLRE